jgi:hypothetical protein
MDNIILDVIDLRDKIAKEKSDLQKAKISNEEEANLTISNSISMLKDFKLQLDSIINKAVK